MSAKIAIQMFLTSPHIDKSNISRDELIKHTLEALDFAQETLAAFKRLNLLAAPFNIMRDKINHLTGLTTNEFRAAFTRHNLQDQAEVVAKIKNLFVQ